MFPLFKAEKPPAKLSSAKSIAAALPVTDISCNAAVSAAAAIIFFFIIAFPLSVKFFGCGTKECAAADYLYLPAVVNRLRKRLNAG